MKMNGIALIVLVFLCVSFIGRVLDQGLVFGQGSHNPNISTDPKNIIINYCKQFEDSVAMGIDVIQELIGAGIVPSSYYGKTCQEETNNINHVNLTG